MNNRQKHYELEKLLTKEFLIEEYSLDKKNKSIYRIAKEIKVVFSTVYCYLKKFGIKIKTASESHKGIKRSKLSCQKQGKTNKKRYENPETHPMFRKKHTEESKQKQSESHKGIERTKEWNRNMSLVKGGTGIPYENENYPEEFNAQFKRKIRKRDNYTCQVCGITEKEYKENSGKKLSVHHIDYDNNNCKQENVISLCNSCHSKTNTDRKYWTKYFQEKMKKREVKV